MKPPSVEAVRLYWLSSGLHGDPDEFFDHFTATAWKYGRAKIEDWTAAARNWSRNEVKWGRTGGKSKYPSAAELKEFNKSMVGANAQHYLEVFRATFGCDPKEI